MYLRKRFSHIKSRIPGVHLLRDPAFLVYSVFRITFGDGKYCLLNVSFISIVVDQTTFQDDLTFIVGQFAQRQGKRCQFFSHFISGDAVPFFFHCFPYIRDKEIIALANGRSPSGIRNGSIPQLIRLER